MSKLTAEKSQIPNPKLQRNPKPQVPSSAVIRLRFLGFGAWSFFGTWNLGFGISFFPHTPDAVAEPARGNDFLLRIKLHAFLALDVEIAEERFAPTGEGKHRHRRGHANVDPDHPGFDPVLKFARGFKHRVKAGMVGI